MNSSPVITLWSLHSRPCCLHPKVDQHCFHQISCVMIHKILPSFKTHYRQQHVRPNYRENTTITASAVFHWGCHFPDQKSKYQRPVFHNVPVPPPPAARVLMPSTFFCLSSYYSRLHFLLFLLLRLFLCRLFLAVPSVLYYYYYYYYYYLIAHKYSNYCDLPCRTVPEGGVVVVVVVASMVWCDIICCCSSFFVFLLCVCVCVCV